MFNISHRSLNAKHTVQITGSDLPYGQTISVVIYKLALHPSLKCIRKIPEGSYWHQIYI